MAGLPRHLVIIVSLLVIALPATTVFPGTFPKAVPEEPYSPKGKPDPFRSFIEKDALFRRARERVQVLPVSPLLQREVDEFRLKGIAFDGRRYTALIEDERGRFYPIREGAGIGTRNGRVTRIFPDHVIVEERIKTPSGQEKVEFITIRLPREGQEGKQ